MAFPLPSLCFQFSVLMPNAFFVNTHTYCWRPAVPTQQSWVNTRSVTCDLNRTIFITFSAAFYTCILLVHILISIVNKRTHWCRLVWLSVETEWKWSCRENGKENYVWLWGWDGMGMGNESWEWEDMGIKIVFPHTSKSSQHPAALEAINSHTVRILHRLRNDDVHSICGIIHDMPWALYCTRSARPSYDHLI